MSEIIQLVKERKEFQERLESLASTMLILSGFINDIDSKIQKLCKHLKLKCDHTKSGVETYKCVTCEGVITGGPFSFPGVHQDSVLKSFGYKETSSNTWEKS